MKNSIVLFSFMVLYLLYYLLLIYNLHFFTIKCMSVIVAEVRAEGARSPMGKKIW